MNALGYGFLASQAGVTAQKTISTGKALNFLANFGGTVLNFFSPSTDTADSPPHVVPGVSGTGRIGTSPPPSAQITDPAKKSFLFIRGLSLLAVLGLGALVFLKVKGKV